jgi:hypothetical protein
MKPLHYAGAGVFAGALAGFIIAWQVKPTAENSSSDSASPLQTRVERRSAGARPIGRFAPSEFSQRWQEMCDEEDVEAKREALLASLGPAEFPALLAEMDDKAGLSGLDNPGENQLRLLFKAWHAKAPDAALTWLRALPKPEDRHRLLWDIVDEIAESNLDGAVSILRQYGTDDEGFIVIIPDKLLEKAVTLGEDKLLEICKLGLNRGGDWPSSCEISYPEGFDFRRVLDGLAAAQAGTDEQARFANLPGNLISEWAKRDFRSAWAWSLGGKSVPDNDTSDLIDATPPADAGVFLAAVFDPAAPEDKRYNEVIRQFYRKPSPEMLEAFLEAAPGEREVHLRGLFDDLGRSNLGEIHGLLLERMSPDQRAEALRRNFSNGMDSQTRSSLARLLRGLGHGDEEINLLLPDLPE